MFLDNYYLLLGPVAPNEVRNNWCHFELRDFDSETFRDFFRLPDQKTSGAKARWHSLEGRPCILITAPKYGSD